MIVKTAVEAVQAKDPAEFPEKGPPEIPLVGRSNVGKSSLINSLLRRRQLARTSGTPGKTRAINFYLVNRAFYLVDLPGYGYARLPHPVRQRWAPLIESYLDGSRPLLQLILLVDSRHPPSSEDQEMLRWLKRRRIPFLVVAAKIDKLPRGRRRGSLSRIRAVLELDDHLIFPFSSLTGEGREELWFFLENALISAGVEG